MCGGKGQSDSLTVRCRIIFGVLAHWYKIIGIGAHSCHFYKNLAVPARICFLYKFG